jgi:hypothetical protein
VVRILPNFNYDNPDGPFDPTRLDVNEEGSFSDWWRSVPAARQVGLSQQFTFLLYDPRQVLSGDYDVNSNPYIVFSRAITKAKKMAEAIVRGKDVMTAKWGSYVDKRLIRYPQSIGFAQVLMYQNGDDVFAKNGIPLGANEKDLPQILQVSNTAESSFLGLVNARAPEYEDNPDDQHTAFVHGDIVDLERGKFVSFFDPSTCMDLIIKLGNLQIPQDATDEDCDSLVSDFLNRHTSHGTKPMADDFKGDGWGAAILDTFPYELGGRKKLFRPSLTEKPEIEEAVYRNVMWWDDLLHFPDQEEICVMMAHAYLEEPNLLEFGWLDHPEFFTDAVRGVLKSRTYHAAPQAELMDDSDAQEGVQYDTTLDENASDIEESAFVPPSARPTRTSATVPKPSSYADVDDVEVEESEVDDEEPVVETPKATVKPVPQKLLATLKGLKKKKAS